MARYKFLVDVSNAKIKVGDIGEGRTPSSNPNDKLVYFTTINNKSVESILKGLSNVSFTLGKQVELFVPQSTSAKEQTTTTMTDKQAQDVGGMFGVDLERMKKIATATYVTSTVGMLAGLGLAFKKKKSVGGYILFAILGSIGGAILGNLGSRPFIKKTGAADAGSGDSGAKKAGSSTGSTSSRKDNEDFMIAESKKSDPSTDGEAIRKFLAPITDSELDTFVKVTKLTNDPEVQKKMAAAKTPDEKKKLFSDLGINPDDLQKIGEKITNAMMSAMGDALGGSSVPKTVSSFIGY